MNILIHGYNTCCQNNMGGVQTRARKFKQLLEEHDNNVSFFSAFDSKLENNDILHIFMATPENLNLIRCAKSKGCKVVISSIINLKGKRKLDFFANFLNKIPKLNTVIKATFDSLALADLVIAETEQEKVFLEKHYKVKPSKIVVIPNGADTEIKNGGDEIHQYVTERYILCVGRFDKNKNQLNLIKAMKDTDITVVFVGGPDHSDSGRDYYQKCVKEANGSKKFVFLGWQNNDSPLLRSAYSNAELLVCPSFQETFGMVLLEGGMAGCKLSISNTLPILEYECFDECITFKPNNIGDIKAKVTKAFNAPKDFALKEKLQSFFSWERIINQHINLYKDLLKR